MHNLNERKVFLTGGHGFLGGHVADYLRSLGANVTRNEGNLLKAKEAAAHVEWCKPDIIIHMAGWNGGLNFNSKHPFEIFSRNTRMALNVLEAAMKHHVRKVVSIVASCAYPEDELVDVYCAPEGGHLAPREIMRESGFFDGPPHDSVACHGYAKRNLQLASMFAKQEHGLNAVCFCPTTLFGPYDSINLEKTKVVMAVVKKVVDAHRQKAMGVSFWGTGSAYRELLYVKDAAKLIVDNAWKYDDCSQPLNLGSGHEFTIAELVSKVVGIVGFEGKVLWDSSKPDGQLRKRLDLTRMNEVVGPFTPTPFDDALRETIRWYEHESVQQCL